MRDNQRPVFAGELGEFGVVGSGRDCPRIFSRDQQCDSLVRMRLWIFCHRDISCAGIPIARARTGHSRSGMRVFPLRHWGLDKEKLMTYTLYLMLCADDSIYTGITTDIKRRFKEHQRGEGSKYTRARKAVKILYTEKFRTRSKASRREVEVKGWSRQKKLSLI